jgi:CubicO group peptidase (beta-lactamase class C family)
MTKSSIYQASKIIIKDNVFEDTHYKSMRDTMYQIASCSKFITGILVAIFYEKGILDYDTDINLYLKSYKCPKNITLRHLLTHTSGSTDKNGYFGLEPQSKKDVPSTTDSVIGNSYSKPFNITEPIGYKFMYSGAGYSLIQLVIEDLTGIPLYKLMKKYIFDKLNMEHSTGKLLYEDKHKYKLASMDYLYRMYPETAAAGLWMSVNDLSILLQDIMNGYNYNSSKILKQETILMVTKGEHPEWNKDFCNYGLGMFVNESKGKKLFAHEGNNYGYKMHFHCIPEKKYIEILMFNHNPKYHSGFEKELRNLL